MDMLNGAHCLVPATVTLSLRLLRLSQTSTFGTAPRSQAGYATIKDCASEVWTSLSGAPASKDGLAYHVISSTAPTTFRRQLSTPRTSSICGWSFTQEQAQMAAKPPHQTS